MCIYKTIFTVIFYHLKTIFPNLNLEKKKFLLGYNGESALLNFLVIIAKNYIYRCKLDKTIPNITGIKQKINYYKKNRLVQWSKK